MKKFIIALMLFTTLAQAQEIIYQPNYADIRNPEKGFYHQRDSWSATMAYNYRPLTITDVNYCNSKNITLIQRIVRLDNYKNAAIQTDFLTLVGNDLTLLKNNGLKCILRFCYSSYDSDEDAWPNDIGNFDPANVYEPPLNIMLNHINQIKIKLASSTDYEAAISSIEAGFIGNWGEWYYSKTLPVGSGPVSDFGLGDPDDLDSQGPAYTFRNNRKQVAEAILNMVPNRMVAFRTPYFQKLWAPSNNLGKQAPFYTGTIFSRIACHNDAFVSNLLDDGTYRDIWENGAGDGGAADRSYLKAKSKHTFTGGESNFYNATVNHSFATCIQSEVNIAQNPLNKTAIKQLEDYHYNYLNEVYFPGIMNPTTGVWANNVFPAPVGGNYLSEVKRRLGYRFVLEKSYITPISNNTNNKLTIEFKNVGFANVFNKRKVYLVLKSSTLTYRLYINGPADFSSSNPPAPGVILGTDVRSWDAYDFTPPTPPQTAAGPIKLTKTLNGLTDINGATVQNGIYQLYLELPDETLTNMPSHSIQFANSGDYTKIVGGVTTNYTAATFWDSLTGLNNLFQSITVSGSNGSKMASGNLADFDIISSPNPFNSSFRLNIISSGEETITVKVYDMLGKLIEDRTVAAHELENLEIGSKLSSGIYNVIVKQGENEKTVRVIKN
jgi:hypothetical protein